MIRLGTSADLAGATNVYRRAALSNAGDQLGLLANPDLLILGPEALAEERTYVAEDDGAIVGFASWTEANGTVELEDLFVDPGYMRRGIATALVGRIANTLRARGVDRLEVTANPHALGFYRAVGFTDCGTAETQFGPAPRMELPIPGCTVSGPTDRQRLPLLEDEDLTGEAVIEPSRLIRPVDAPKVAVACFFRDVVEELAGRQDARPVCRLHSEMGPASLWEIEHRGVRLGVFHPGVGAPLAGAMLEQVIARGVRGVIACGGAGALVPELVMGHAVILTGALRDEGTSFHYLPAGRVVSADPGPAESLADALSAAGVETTHGLSWSTDAIYRETRARVSRRVEEGCLVVEMEASALMAIARYRSIPFGEVVMAGDSLVGKEWQHRGWMTATSARRQLFASAADAAVALTR